MENKKAIIFQTSEIDKIIFSEVIETNIERLRISINGEKTFIKYDESQVPSFIENLTTKEGPYDFEEFLEILQSDYWNSVLPLPD